MADNPVLDEPSTDTGGDSPEPASTEEEDIYEDEEDEDDDDAKQLQVYYGEEGDDAVGDYHANPLPNILAAPPQSASSDAAVDDDDVVQDYLDNYRRWRNNPQSILSTDDEGEQRGSGMHGRRPWTGFRTRMNIIPYM